MRKVKILVATHKQAEMPKNRGLYLPVLVNAKRNFQVGIDYQRDDRGENISYKNANYNELTAIYWAWKNLSDVDAIGLVHYQRFFFKPGCRKTIDNVIGQQDVDLLLKNHDVILPEKRNYFIESNYSHYVHAHHEEPLLKTRQILAERYPEYLEAYDVTMQSNKAHMFNMFVMKKPQFDAYATWLFDVLARLEPRIDVGTYSVQEARVYGYIAELLMDVWIETNNVNYAEIKWGVTGRKQTVSKVYDFLLRKFFQTNANLRKIHF